MIFASILSSIKDYNKTTADLDPFGGRYTPQEKRARAASHKSFHEKMMASNDNDDGPAKPAGPTPDQLVAQQVAAARAAKKAAKRRMGRERRKKYEAAETMAKKMKLLFVD